MKVLRKLAIPQIIIVICLGLISFIVINSSFADMRKHYVNDVIENRLQMINKEIEVGSRKAVSEASVFVRLPAVMEAYDIALSGDIDDPYSPQSQKAREFLRRELAPMLDSHSEITGYKLQLHFHLPNGLSLARLWREKQTMIDGKWVDISDDISSFRPTVMDVNRTGKIVMGLEPGSGGFAIRGVVPVTTPEGRQIGSAEVLQEFNPILETVNDTGKFFISLYANKEHLDFSIELRDREKYPAKGDFIRVVEAKDSSVEALITAELLKKGREGFFAADHASMTVAAFPLNDYRGRQTGVMVCAMNTQAVSRLANTATLILAIMITGMVIAPLFVLLLRLRRLV
ncbi:MAG: chemotaxis protein, partial [Acidobacteriota bacterium]|nr:chemotaxis protein [Acidobacteriota bacterium]